MSFVDMLLFYGRATPEKPAIILIDRIVTFGMLASGIRSATAAIRLAGLSASHTIGVQVESPTKHLIVVSALYRLGIVSVSITGGEDPVAAGLKLDATISDQPNIKPQFGRYLKLEDHWLMKPADPNERITGFSSDDQLARIVMSSGTTATPKAIGHTVKVVEDRIITGKRTLALAPWDRMMCLPVLTSSLGLGSALQALAFGHSVVIAESAVDALQMIMLYSVDLLVCNPRHLIGMVDEHRKSPIPTPSLRLIKYGGGVVVPDLAIEVRERFCKDVLCVYSSTESGPIAFGHIEHIKAQPGSTGLVAPWVDVEIVDAQDRALPADVEGRLRVRSRWQGYDLREGPVAVQKWMYPGDIAKVTQNGSLCLIGRSADAIRIGDSLISPEQIEQALYGYPGIDDVAAAGMEQSNGQMEIWLAVIAPSGVDVVALRGFLLEKNPAWRVATIKFVDKFRRNDMGKIVRSRVKDILLAK